jgi:arylsulfatase
VYNEVLVGGGLGKGGTAKILVNGEKVASGRIERTQAMVFSADETVGVGVDDATPVTADHEERDNAFTGTTLKATVDVQPIGDAFMAAEESTGVDAAARMAPSS